MKDDFSVSTSTSSFTRGYSGLTLSIGRFTECNTLSKVRRFHISLPEMSTNLRSSDQMNGTQAWPRQCRLIPAWFCCVLMNYILAMAHTVRAYMKTGRDNSHYSVPEGSLLKTWNRDASSSPFPQITKVILRSAERTEARHISLFICGINPRKALGKYSSD